MTSAGSGMTGEKKVLGPDFLWVGSSGRTSDATGHVYEKAVRSHVQRWSKTRPVSTRLRGRGLMDRKRKVVAKTRSAVPLSPKQVDEIEGCPSSAPRATHFTTTPVAPISGQETPTESEGLDAMQMSSRGTIEVDPSAMKWPQHHPSFRCDEIAHTREVLPEAEGAIVPATSGDDPQRRDTVQFRIQQTVRLWQSIAPTLSATLDSDRLEKMVRCHHITFSTVCSVKKAATTRESQEEALRFEQLMRKGCKALQANKVKEAFKLFDEAFSYLKPILILQNIRGQPMLCRLIAEFSGPLFVPLWHRVYQHIIGLAEVLVSPDNPFGQSADLFIRSPLPLADASEMVLRCILDVVQTQLGALHPDAMDCLECLAWSLFERGREQEALTRFTELLQKLEAARGPMSPEACDALRGLAETHVRLGDLDAAEDMFDEVLGWRSLGGDRKNLQVTAVRVKCLLSLSLLAERRQNSFRARWLLHQAAQTTSLAFGKDGQMAAEAGVDAKPLGPDLREEVRRLLAAVESWSLD